METYILKIGGGSVTLKDENKREARPEVIRRIAREIKKAKQEKEFRLVVVHGAGPFGHKLVTDYGINDGIKSARDIEGFVRTQNSMKDLNKIFMDIFREEGLLGFPVQSSACIIQNGKKIARFDTSIIERLLETGPDIVPVMHGDMVVDESLGASVVSGDAIVSHLASKLKANRVLMGTDVDGIFGADPKVNPDAMLIKRIDHRNLESVMKSLGEAVTVDVTQGMKGKVMSILESLSGFDVLIFNITREDDTYKALTGQNVIGTEISL